MAKPTIEVPDKIFKVPTQEELQLNHDYWGGYDSGKADKDNVPGPAGYKDYAAYKTACEKQLYKKATDTGFPVNYNVGYNNCIADIFNYLWTTDPQSPHKVPPAA